MSMNQGIFAIGMLVSRYFEPRFNATLQILIFQIRMLRNRIDALKIVVEVDGFEPTTSSLPASICKWLISVTRLFSAIGTLRSLHIMHHIARDCKPLQVELPVYQTSPFYK